MTELKIESCSDFEREFILDKIIECLNVAFTNGGAVFAGYVRDVLIPRSVSPKCKVTFRNVNIWFKSVQDRNNFLGDMGTSLRITGSHENRSQYFLYYNMTKLATIEIYVHNSDLPPVNDFNVNQLFYSNGKYSDVNLLDFIKQKKAVMLDEYCELLTGMPLEKASTIPSHFEHINRCYLDKGWKLYTSFYWNLTIEANKLVGIGKVNIIHKVVTPEQIAPKITKTDKQELLNEIYHSLDILKAALTKLASE